MVRIYITMYSGGMYGVEHDKKCNCTARQNFYFEFSIIEEWNGNKYSNHDSNPL